MKPQRLDKLIATQLGKTRREALFMLRRGWVCLNGQVCRAPAQKVDPERDRISVQGQEVAYRQRICLMLNKPAGVLCVSRDPHAPTVVDFVPEPWNRRGLFPAGRLDKDSTGLVLLTDDGDLGHRLISPKKEVYKLYHVRVDAPVTEQTVRDFAEGITLADGTVCRPAGLRVLENGDHALTEVAICEGRYHQIKRMFGVCGLGVISLRRVAIGGLKLDEALAERECRPLSEEEECLLFCQNPAYLENYYHYLTK